MRIQLDWIDPVTGRLRRPQYDLPVAIGREFSQLPQEIDGQRVARLTLEDPDLLPYHGALQLNVLGEPALVLQPQARAGVNGRPYGGTTAGLQTGDRLQLGALELTITILREPDSLHPSASLSPSTPERAWGATVVPASPPAPRSPAGTPQAPGPVPCDRLVGFLFPRRCGRISRENCPHCRGGEIGDDPYFLASERSIYTHYGDYSASPWGREGLDSPADPSAYDFTEADAAAFAVTATDFEQDLDAS